MIAIQLNGRNLIGDIETRVVYLRPRKSGVSHKAKAFLLTWEINQSPAKKRTVVMTHVMRIGGCSSVSKHAPGFNISRGCFLAIVHPSSNVIATVVSSTGRIGGIFDLKCSYTYRGGCRS
ncbi:hypothetical protein WA026_003011 [Henosepilachna vigintioctopunctata]|uniref:Uncharacterized protein n=1 Tax=Henosepilachna vigintioctopunctata TaxID=420089 RepID=A0AAW1TIE0_9CUCU